MTVYADGIGRELALQGMSPSQVLKEVERQVRENFPEKFRNPNKDNAPRVEVGGKPASRSSGFRLTTEEETIMNKLIRSGAPITREEYINQIKKARGV